MELGVQRNILGEDILELNSGGRVGISYVKKGDGIIFTLDRRTRIPEVLR